LDVVIVLGKKMPEIFEDLDPFKDFPIDTETVVAMPVSMSLPLPAVAFVRPRPGTLSRTCGRGKGG
jgi:hypothetical protein